MTTYAYKNEDGKIDVNTVHNTKIGVKANAILSEIRMLPTLDWTDEMIDAEFKVLSGDIVEVVIKEVK